MHLGHRHTKMKRQLLRDMEVLITRRAVVSRLDRSVTTTSVAEETSLFVVADVTHRQRGRTATTRRVRVAETEVDREGGAGASSGAQGLLSR